MSPKTFDMAAYQKEVEAMTAEERFDALVELYTEYAKIKIRPPCRVTIEGTEFSVLMQLSTPSLYGPLQFASYLATMAQFDKHFQYAMETGNPAAVPLHTLFFPKEQVVLFKTSVLQTVMDAEECRRAEFAVASQSSDPEVQNFLADMVLMPVGMAIGGADA